MGDREDEGPRTRYGGNRRRSGAYDLRYSEGGPRYYEAVNRREYWDEQSRPSWNSGVCDAVLAGVPKKVQNGRQVYQCQKCLRFFPKKAVAEPGGAKHWITIEHHTPWADHIWKKAASVNDNGKIRIPIASATLAYNDQSNLRAYSSKGGWAP